VFVLGKPFQPSLIFLSTAGAYPEHLSGAPLYDWLLARLAIEKHYNLFGLFFGRGEKKFYNRDTW
jgi:hypothetical protein